ncbi:hypothetical protein D3C75_1079740 [compost metagenome]
MGLGLKEVAVFERLPAPVPLAVLELADATLASAVADAQIAVRLQVVPGCIECVTRFVTQLSNQKRWIMSAAGVVVAI